MRLEELREVVLDNVNRHDLSHDRVDGYLNTILKRVARYHNWKDLYVKAVAETTPGDSEYHMPVDEDKLKDLISVTLIEDGERGVRLLYIPYRRLHILFPNPAFKEKGTPTKYTIWDNVMQLFPVPDKEYELHIMYNKWPDLLVEGLEPEITGIDDVLTTGATSMAFMYFQQIEISQEWHQQFSLFLAEAVKADSVHTDEELKLKGYQSGPRKIHLEQDIPLL